MCWRLHGRWREIVPGLNILAWNRLDCGHPVSGSAQSPEKAPKAGTCGLVGFLATLYLVGPFLKLMRGSLREEEESSLGCPRNIRWARLRLHPQRHN